MLKTSLIIILYFLISWFFPWEVIQINSSISASYLFDLVFVLSLHFILEDKLLSIGIFSKKAFIPILGSCFIAFLCILAAMKYELKAPFRYIDQIAIQLLILAPLLEELVFRGAFFSLIRNKVTSINVQALLSSILFSLSHLNAIRFLPEVFHSFIYFQVGYTFILGWICFKARVKSDGVFLPILIHFGFNFVFYCAVKSYGF